MVFRKLVQKRLTQWRTSIPSRNWLFPHSSLVNCAVCWKAWETGTARARDKWWEEMREKRDPSPSFTSSHPAEYEKTGDESDLLWTTVCIWWKPQLVTIMSITGLIVEGKVSSAPHLSRNIFTKFPSLACYIGGRVTLSTLGKLFITTSFNALYVFSAELFRTVVRCAIRIILILQYKLEELFTILVIYGWLRERARFRESCFPIVLPARDCPFCTRKREILWRHLLAIW